MKKERKRNNNCVLCIDVHDNDNDSYLNLKQRIKQMNQNLTEDR